MRSSIVRLAPMVHSDLDKHGFTSVLIGCARENGFAAYIGEGANRWPAAHTRDAAALYRLALEKAPAGSRLHGVTDTGIPFKTIAETIAAELGVEARGVTADEAPSTSAFWQASPASTPRCRERQDPRRPGLGADPPALDRGRPPGHYFA